MERHTVRVYRSSERLARPDQLAWKLAEVATAEAPQDHDAVVMVINRMIDNAGVALAAIQHEPVAVARRQAMSHSRAGGAAVFGLRPHETVHAEWAAWANGAAVRQLDMHDTFLAADYAHPADNIPPILAVAQQCRCSGTDLVRAILTAYEVHIALVKAICLHAHKKDHIAHLCPAQVAGIGCLLRLPTETVYQAIQHAVHVCFTTRQSRKGEISSWKAFAPAHAGQLAIVAVDRAMRGLNSPSPIYEGEDSVIAYMLDGADSEYTVSVPAPNQPRRAILESYTKEHSAEYQSQALIDLAFRMRECIDDTSQINGITIHTSHHTHHVIGTGAGDPQKYDPQASRETLDHSVMYIFAVALQDGCWHHVHSYTRQRATRPDTVSLWKKIVTVEDADWTSRYHAPDPSQKAFGGHVVIQMNDGRRIEDSIRVARAHPSGNSAFTFADYVAKFERLTVDITTATDREQYIALCQRLPELTAAEIRELNLAAVPDALQDDTNVPQGIFDGVAS